MSMLIATAMSARATGKTGRPSITVLDECWFLLDSPALAPEVVQLYRTARKRNSSVWGISQTVEDFVGTEFQPRIHGPGILKNASTKIVGQQPGDVTPMVNHLNLNPVAVNQVKGFGAPRKGRSAEVLLVIGEKAETTQTIRIVPTPLSYWICTTFPRERKYRGWFLKKHERRPLLQCYQELARKFPQGLADVSPLLEEISGEVNGVARDYGGNGERKRGALNALSCLGRMTEMQVLLYMAFFATFTWFVVTVQNHRRLLAVTLAGVMVVTLVGAPQPAQAQLGILGAIQAVLNVINGVIQTALTSINKVRTELNNLQQLVVWPQQLINQARALVTQMIGQYRNLMSNIFHIKLNSATLPNPQALEAVIRDHQVNNFPGLTATFANVYGAIPVETAANPGDRAMSDMDDALALDNLKTLKAGDQSTDIELQSADAIENSSSQAAPGSAPFLTATAITSAVHAQALTQKLLAAELRQEAARIAHRNTLRKENATNTTQLRGVLVNLLQHQ